VDLHDGLEEIGKMAFYLCRSLRAIVIPQSVKEIHNGAFDACRQLTSVVLPVGLKEIRADVFCSCSSLRAIEIPQTVKEIHNRAFQYCTQLSRVALPEGLEKIGMMAFSDCSSLLAITIPKSVVEIHSGAFNNCSQLTHVQFCEAIEVFVSGESMRDWWNHGVSKTSLSTYCFFARCKIPARVGHVRARKWQANIHEMLRHIPSIPDNELNAYFELINSKLSLYENLNEAPMLLELSIYRGNAFPNTNIDDLLSTDIVPRILSYLIEG
jgi:hypothetical protein